MNPEQKARIPEELKTSARRRARLSYAALLGITLLLAVLAVLRAGMQTYARPRLVRASDGLHLFVDEVLPGADGASVTTLHYRIGDDGTPAQEESLSKALYLPYDGAMIAFSGQGASVTRKGVSTSIAIDVEGKTIAATFAASKDAWLVGLRESDRMLIAARVALSKIVEASPGDILKPEETVAMGLLPAQADLVNLQVMEIGGRPAVTYTIDPDEAAILQADGRPPMRIEGPVSRAAAVADGDAPILIVHRWQMHRFGKLEFVSADPELREPIVLDDPRVMGRRVTGIAAERTGQGAIVVLARSMSVQWFPAKIEGGRLVATGGLVTIRAVPTWKLIGSTFLPPFVLFGSIALIYLGRSLYHDRREILARLLGVPLPAPLYAGAIDRSFAYAIDFLLLTPVLTVLLQYLGVAITTLVGWDAAVLLGTFGGIQFVYFFVMELTIGQSIGKRIIGIRVQRADGRRVGIVGAFVRNVVRLLDASGCMCVVGFFMILVTKRKQRLGDILGRTVVVPAVKPAPPVRKETPPENPQVPA